MAYISNVKFLMKFDDISLLDSVSGLLLQPVGSDQNINILDDGLGYVMKKNQYLEGSESSAGEFRLDISTSFAIGFWLYSVNPGMAENGGGEIQSIRMPLLDLYSISGSAPFSIISIFEKTHYNNNNSLTLELNDGDYKQISPYYSVGMWHYFWLVYKNSSLKIFIDGSLQIASQIAGSVPDNIDGDILNIYINRNITGYAFNKIDNTGYVDDIVIFNSVPDPVDEYLQKIINYSIDYLIDVEYQNKVDKNFGIIFNDPSTLSINSMVNDMSYIYLGRNDGKILRGSPLFWECRRIFSNEEEIDRSREFIIKEKNPDESKAEIENGVLKIKNSIIKL